MPAVSTYLQRLRTGLRSLVDSLRYKEWIRRLKKAPSYYGHGLYHQLMHKDIFLWAQAIAFKVLITIVPVIILASGVLGQVLKREKPFETVSNYIRNFLPTESGDQIVGALRQLADAGDLFTIVGVLGLLFSAITLFTTLRITVGNVFQEEWHEDRSILGGYLFDLRMVIQVGLFFILTFSFSLAVQTLNNAGFEFIESVGLDYVWVQEGWRRAIKTLGLIIPFFLTTMMFFQLFYFVPKPHPPKRSVLIGSLFTAVLWEGAKSGFALYATTIGHFDRYSSAGAGAGSAISLGETFGLIIAFVFWVYFSGLMLMLGAIIVLLHEKGHRSRRAAAIAEATEKDEEPAIDAGGDALPERAVPPLAEAPPAQTQQKVTGEPPSEAPTPPSEAAPLLPSSQKPDHEEVPPKDVSAN
jgi:membrane protein